MGATVRFADWKRHSKMASLSEALSIALDHYFAGRKDEAGEIAGRILDAVPDHPRALHLAGVVAGERGALDEAAAFLTRAARSLPVDAAVAGDLARVLNAAGRTDEADAVLRRIAPSSPADPEIAAATARLAERSGDFSAAFAWRRRAFRLTTRSTALESLADCAAAAGMDDAARAARRDHAALAPDSAAVWGRLGPRLEKDGSLTGAPSDWPMLERSLRLDPQGPMRRSALWAARRATGLDAAYHSHEGQDALVHRNFFPHLRGGVFVDVGAFDGTTWSNTLFFEREMGWNGVCVEASPARCADYLRAGRRAPCLNVAAGDRDGEAAFMEVSSGMTMMNGLVDTMDPDQRALAESGGAAVRTIVVPLRRLDGLLRERGLSRVHFLSVDVEGAERAVLAGLDPAACTVDVVCLESLRADPELRALMDARGYDFFCRFAGGDEIFVRRGFSPASAHES